MGGFRLEVFVFEVLRLWVLRLEVVGFRLEVFVFEVLRLWVLGCEVFGFGVIGLRSLWQFVQSVRPIA